MMKAMKIGLCLGSLLLLCRFAEAQPVAGSLLIDGNALLSKQFQNNNNNLSMGLAPVGGLFINEHFLIGAKAGLLGYRFDEDWRIRSGYVAPFARYYFNGKGASRFFIEGSAGWEHYYYKFSDTPVKENALTFSIGGGLTTWLTDDIVMNNSLLYGQRNFIGEAADQYDPYRALLWNASLQAVLPAKLENVRPVLGKGTYRIGLQGNGGWTNAGVRTDFSLSVEPSLGYFVIDHLMVGASLQLAVARDNRIIDGQYYVRYYPLAPGSRWQPFAEFGGGTRLQLLAEEPDLFDSNIKTGLGLDYFITPSIALEAQAYYYLGKAEEPIKFPKLVEFSVGLKFFLNDLPFFYKKN